MLAQSATDIADEGTPAPDTATDDLGEHYFADVGEKPPAGQYETTIAAIITHAYTKGYGNAARTIEAERVPNNLIIVATFMI